MRKPRETEAGPDVGALQGQLRRRGFDLRRAAFVTWFVETGRDREAAFAVRRQAAAQGWRPTLYADGSGWVVRLCRTGSVRRDALERDRRQVQRLAGEHAARPRAVAVEEAESQDVWDALAVRQRALQLPVTVPARRRSAVAEPGVAEVGVEVVDRTA